MRPSGTAAHDFEISNVVRKSDVGGIRQSSTADMRSNAAIVKITAAHGKKRRHLYAVRQKTPMTAVAAARQSSLPGFGAGMNIVLNVSDSVPTADTVHTSIAAASAAAVHIFLSIEISFSVSAFWRTYRKTAAVSTVCICFKPYT